MKKRWIENQVLLIISNSTYNWAMDCPFLSDVNKDVMEEFAKKQVEIFKPFSDGKVTYEFYEK